MYSLHKKNLHAVFLFLMKNICIYKRRKSYLPVWIVMPLFFSPFFSDSNYFKCDISVDLLIICEISILSIFEFRCNELDSPDDYLLKSDKDYKKQLSDFLSIELKFDCRFDRKQWLQWGEAG